jgi:tetratricopeptide (TPR) repeat protein
MGIYSASDSLYEHLLADDKNDAVSLNNYAYSIADREQVTRKQLKFARKLSKRSLKDNKNNPSFLDTYGWIWFQLGKTRQAYKYIASSLEVRADNPEVLSHMAAILKVQGKDEEARTYADKAEAILRQRQELVRAETSKPSD